MQQTNLCLISEPFIKIIFHPEIQTSFHRRSSGCLSGNFRSDKHSLSKKWDFQTRLFFYGGGKRGWLFPIKFALLLRFFKNMKNLDRIPRYPAMALLFQRKIKRFAKFLFFMRAASMGKGLWNWFLWNNFPPLLVERFFTSVKYSFGSAYLDVKS